MNDTILSRGIYDVQAPATPLEASLTGPQAVGEVLSARYELLLSWFRRYQEVFVAYSGGVDSTFVLRAAADALGPEKVTALTADSASLARSELDETISFARELGVRHQLLSTSELNDPRYTANRGDRCFFCKQNLYDTLFEQLPDLLALLPAGAYVVVDGANFDDRSDDRPGARAADAAGIRHPLDELEFSKMEIREHSRRLGLPTWNKPAMACLASRLAPGVPVTAERLSKVEQVEKLLADEGIKGGRVRLHLVTTPTGEELSLARIELANPAAALPLSEKLVAIARTAGFSFVTLDLEGYKRGGRPLAAGEHRSDNGTGEIDSAHAQNQEGES